MNDIHALPSSLVGRTSSASVRPLSLTHPWPGGSSLAAAAVSALLLLAAAAQPAAAVVNPPPGFTALFNGVDLKGWRGGETFDQRKLLAMTPEDREELHVIAVVPRYPDNAGPVIRWPGLMARHDVVRACRRAGGDRFAVYDLENPSGTPVYVHAKVAIVDDVWAMVGLDNLNRRSWSHDSELSIGVLDSTRDARAPADPAGLGDGAHLRLRPAAPAVVRAPGPGRR